MYNTSAFSAVMLYPKVKTDVRLIVRPNAYTPIQVHDNKSYNIHVRSALNAVGRKRPVFAVFFCSRKHFVGFSSVRPRAGVDEKEDYRDVPDARVYNKQSRRPGTSESDIITGKTTRSGRFSAEPRDARSERPTDGCVHIIINV